MKVTHLTREEGEKNLHISHLMKYISAYEICEETINDLSEQIEKALIKAKETVETQIVDQDGEGCLHITPAGYIILMMPWKIYKVNKEK